MRILVVEDDPLVAAGIKQGLDSAGFTTDITGSAEAAETFLQEESFDLAVVDIGLPKANGFTLVRRLREKGLRLPVLFLTARDSVEDTVTLNQVTEDSANVFIDRALAKNVDLGYEIAEAETEGIDWMLREALGNLIDNAINYTPAGGSITVKCHADLGRPVLAVDDSGPGIPAEERQKVFDRFYRISDGEAEGCGLGLAIVKEIADIHGAEIRLSESDSGGLSISLHFPPVSD